MSRRASTSIAARGRAKAIIFGPFASAGAVGRTINSLQRAFLLRSCTNSFLREPHAPVPAVPDQALRRPLHRRDLAWGLCRAGRRGEGFPLRPQPEGEDGNFRRHAAGLRGPRFRARRHLSRPLAALSHVQSHQGIIRRPSTRPMFSPSIRKAARSVSRCFSSAPARTGATVPISPRPIRRWKQPRCWARSWRSSMTTSRRHGRSSCRMVSRIRNCWPRRCRPGRPQGRDPGARSVARKRI